jgi:hypothetical protein
MSKSNDIILTTYLIAGIIGVVVCLILVIASLLDLINAIKELM